MIKSEQNIYSKIVLLTILLLSSPFRAYPDDSSAEITPKGLQFKRMDSISVESEDLFISANRIEVSMTFFNHSNTDISTIVAFPIPEYRFNDRPVEHFKDFKVEVDGKEVKYQTEIRALNNGKDYTKLLQKMHLSIEDFANFYPSGWKDTVSYFFPRLSPQNQELLLKEGLVNDGQHKFPLWSVSIKYFWKQSFPVTKSITIKHRYRPVCGYQLFTLKAFNVQRGDSEYHVGTSDPAFLKKDGCLSKNKLATLISKQSERNLVTPGNWVSYILKSALNWSQPIKALHVTVEKSSNEIMSSCFEKYLTQTSRNRYEGTLKDFIPKEDIKVYFFPFAR